MSYKYLTSEFFSKSLLDPMWLVGEVIDNPTHPQHKNLKDDLYGLNKAEMDLFVQENHIDDFLNRNADKDLGRRTHFFINLIQEEIINIRLNKLTISEGRPEPYNNPNLENVVIDKNGLVYLNQFNLNYCSLEINNLVYMLCPTIASSNSSYWTFQTLMECYPDANFKIRLDPLMEIPVDDYNPMMYKMYIYGKPLDWKRIVELRNDEFGQWFDEKFNKFGMTDFVWSPSDGEIHFTCEELPKSDGVGDKISRYFHAIFNKETGNIKHCDGAIRIFSQEELEYRTKFHVRQPEVRKAGKRVKIFQFDSTENNGQEINQNVFCKLILSFFVWNQDIFDYFN